MIVKHAKLIGLTLLWLILSGLAVATHSSKDVRGLSPPVYKATSPVGFNQTERCIEARVVGAQLRFTSACEQPIIMVFCVLAERGVWSCGSNAMSEGQLPAGRGDYFSIPVSALAEPRPNNGIAVGCIPKRFGPALLVSRPLDFGPVHQDPCYRAANGLNRALDGRRTADLQRILRTFGFSIGRATFAAVGQSARAT